MSPAASRDDLRRVEETLAIEVRDVARDVARLDKAIQAHIRAHAREASGRVSSRRWLIGIAIALIAAIDGPIVTVLLHMH